MLWKTASEFGEDTTSMVDWVRNFPWDYMSTASTRALLNTFTPLLIANYLIAIQKHTNTTNRALSDVGVKLVQSLYLIHMSVSCQSAVHTYLVPAHQTTTLNPLILTSLQIQ